MLSWGALCEVFAPPPERSAADSTRSAACWPFDAAYGTKFLKVATKITDNLDELLAFYDYPAEHWILCGVLSTFGNLLTPPMNRDNLSSGSR